MGADTLIILKLGTDKIVILAYQRLVHFLSQAHLFVSNANWKPVLVFLFLVPGSNFHFIQPLTKAKLTFETQRHVPTRVIEEIEDQTCHISEKYKAFSFNLFK